MIFGFKAIKTPRDLINIRRSASVDKLGDAIDVALPSVSMRQMMSCVTFWSQSIKNIRWMSFARVFVVISPSPMQTVAA